MLRGEPGNHELKHGEMLLVVATGTDRDVVQGPNGSFQERPHGTSQEMPIYKRDLMEELREGPHCKRNPMGHYKRVSTARETL